MHAQVGGLPCTAELSTYLQVFEQYERFVGPSGLSEEGLRQIYADGNGNVDIDFLTLGLSLSAPVTVRLFKWWIRWSKVSSCTTWRKCNYS